MVLLGFCVCIKRAFACFCVARRAWLSCRFALVLAGRGFLPGVVCLLCFAAVTDIAWSRGSVFVEAFSCACEVLWRRGDSCYLLDLQLEMMHCYLCANGDCYRVCRCCRDEDVVVYRSGRCVRVRCLGAPAWDKQHKSLHLSSELVPLSSNDPCPMSSKAPKNVIILEWSVIPHRLEFLDPGFQLGFDCSNGIRRLFTHLHCNVADEHGSGNAAIYHTFPMFWILLCVVKHKFGRVDVDLLHALVSLDVTLGVAEVRRRFTTTQAHG